MNLKKIGELFTSNFVGTGPSSYKKRLYRAAVSQMLRNTGIGDSRRFVLPPSLFYKNVSSRPPDDTVWQGQKFCRVFCFEVNQRDVKGKGLQDAAASCKPDT